MSISLIFGNFTVVGGEAASDGRASHVQYKTSIYTEDDVAPIPAMIRAYSPSNSTLLQDETTVFVYGKLCGSTKGPYHIEAIKILPYPGDPSEVTHGVVPLFTPRVCVLGHLSGVVETMYDGTRKFKVNSTAWVKDKLQATAFMASFENTARWKRTPIPNPNSAIHLLGPISRLDDDTQLAIINIEEATFNAGSRQSNSSVIDGGNAVSKPRRYPVTGWASGVGNSKPSTSGDYHEEGSVMEPASQFHRVYGSSGGAADPSVVQRSNDVQESFSLKNGDSGAQVTGNAQNGYRREEEHVFENVSGTEDLSMSYPRTEYVSIGGRPATPHPWAGRQNGVGKENVAPSPPDMNHNPSQMLRDSFRSNAVDMMEYQGRAVNGGTGMKQPCAEMDDVSKGDVRKSKRLRLKVSARENHMDDEGIPSFSSEIPGHATVNREVVSS